MSPVTNSFKENGVSIETTAFPENTVLKVQTIPENDAKISAIKTAIPLATDIIAYEITATSDNVTVQPNGTVEVAFPFPAKFNKDLQTATVYYVADTGNVEAMPTTLGTGSITAILSHFSTYAVVVTAKTVESDIILSDVSSVVSDIASVVESNTESQPNPSTESTPEPTPEPTISVEKKSFKMFKRVDNYTVNQIELTFGNTDNNNFCIMIEVGDSVEKIYEDFSKDSESAPTYEEFLTEFLANSFVFEDSYYYVGRGDYMEVPITSISAGSVTFERTDEDAVSGSLSYTSEGDTITITAVTGNTILSEYISVGDTLTLYIHEEA